MCGTARGDRAAVAAPSTPAVCRVASPCASGTTWGGRGSRTTRPRPSAGRVSKRRRHRPHLRLRRRRRVGCQSLSPGFGGTWRGDVAHAGPPIRRPGGWTSRPHVSDRSWSARFSAGAGADRISGAAVTLANGRVVSIARHDGPILLPTRGKAARRGSARGTSASVAPSPGRQSPQRADVLNVTNHDATGRFCPAPINGSALFGQGSARQFRAPFRPPRGSRSRLLKTLNARTPRPRVCFL